ncbi:WXG100 family type VII secretion target [Nonomuraea sp. NPDC052129]|uniref:WXG100 family type VII secretion target n=1 Tax=Nonomuraea sp. NPDC052129 TaxID=3154651 RepID=UPI003412A4A0
MPSNPVLRTVSKFAGTLVGTMYSSPSDIREAARNTRDMKTTIHDAATSIDTALNTIDSDDWEKMARPDVDAAVKKFTSEAKNSSQVYEELAGALDQLARNSFQMSVASLSVATILVTLSHASVVSKFIPGFGAAADLATAASGSAALGTLRTVATSSMAVFAKAAAIAGLVAVVMQMVQNSSTKMGKAVTPTDPKSMPAFEQVVIPNLPMFGKDGKALGMKKDA